MSYSTFDGVTARFDFPEKEIGADLHAAILRVAKQDWNASSQQIVDRLASEGIAANFAAVDWVLGR